MVVEAWGTGRRDYSDNVELYTNPTLKDWTAVAKSARTFTLLPWEQKEIPIDFSFVEGAHSHFVTNVVVSADANVLLYGEIGTWYSVYGYQKICIEMPHALPISSLTLKVRNCSDQTINCIYFHTGSQGYEKVLPVIRRVRLW